MAEKEEEEEKTAIVLLVDGSEEMEAVITIDVLRRAGVRHLERSIIPSLVTFSAENESYSTCMIFFFIVTFHVRAHFTA